MDLLYMWISSLIHSIYALEKKNNITHLILRTQRRRRKIFFVGGFGFASRDGNKGMDLVLPWVGLVLQVTSRSVLGFAGDFTECVWFCHGSLLLLLPLLIFLLSSSSPSFCFVLLLRFSDQLD